MMHSRPIKYSMSALLAAAVLALSACVTEPKVHSELDRTADFSQYKTFGFISPLGTDRDGYQTIVSQLLKASTQRQMEARGLRYDAAAPQLLINFNADLSEKLKISSVPSSSFSIGFGGYGGGGYYGYRAGVYSAWPLYNDDVMVTKHQEGTINIDVVDAARKQLVWESVVKDSVNKKDLDNLPAALDAAVVLAFTKYPGTGVSK